MLAFAASAASAQEPAEQCDPADSAQQCAASDEGQVARAKPGSIEIVEVYGVSGSNYRASRSGDMRQLSDLAGTPQTMSILTQTQILDSGKSDLKEILSSQAGVTLGTGENGNAFGDRYVIRGHEARSDVFVDGIRDPGMTTRESFAAEQIEITKGPSSTFAGRGSSGGAVNTITKAANPNESFSIVDASVGTDDYYRVTLDSNLQINEDFALRFNGLGASEEIPDRDGLERERLGALLSGYANINDRWNAIADVYYLEADDVPDLGSYFDREVRKPVEDIPVYAQDNDFLDTEALSTTLRLNGELSDNWRLAAAVRYGTTDNGYITTGLRGTTRDESDPVAPGAPTMSLSTHQGWQEIEYGVAQANLFWDTALVGQESRFVFGTEYMTEEVDNGVYDYEATGETNCVVGGRFGASESYCIIDAAGNVVDDPRGLMQRRFSRGERDAEYEIDTISAYVMNTTQLGDNWEVFLGLRVDSYDYSNDINGRSGELYYEFSDTLTNGHIGLVRKLGDSGNVYATYSTATNINGGESDVGGSCGYGGLCGTPEQAENADPESVENIELGTKWQLFDERLLATAAVFRITKSDVMESVGDSYSQLGTLNTGKNRVEGVEISLTGAITDTLSIQLSAALMDSEVIDSFNPENEGLALSNFADDSLYALLRWEPNERWAFGGAYTYQSEMYGGQPDSAAGFDPELGDYSIVVPDYGVFDLFVNYNFSDQLNFRLNVNNVTDEEYWTAAYRSGSFMYLGDARSARLSLVYEFN
ncbi:TonB-dependent siderophore receptor [Mangrovimicrobium sediminis]|uniref:TonB-dependent siderophore receptor n=2 Tax=Mangrovimicrobium sediminis TaxID=2562682 RepID=A0A4Z0LUZ1_9GAMM|nr:TonB-dependent siderophore receptor [Haliea sp. SAOS-164]